jgi:hypothetical protein
MGGGFHATPAATIESPLAASGDDGCHFAAASGAPPHTAQPMMISVSDRNL